MIGRLTAPYLDWCASRRRRRLEALWRDPATVQESTLLRLISGARDTEFGLAHGFAGIRSVRDYQARVPLRGYREMRPYFERALAGERHLTWPGRPREWARTPGTTGESKLIPLTVEALQSHRRGAWDALLMAIERVGAADVVSGPWLLLGGSTATRTAGAGCRVADLSGLAIRHLPASWFPAHSADHDTASIPDWDQRVDAIAQCVGDRDLRLLAGIPPWLLVLFERVAQHRRAVGLAVRDLRRCWPNLRVLVHGGVAFAPYAAAFDEWIGRRLECVEVYPTSEAFVAIQTERTGSLTLMVDYDVFYEFVPLEDLSLDTPRRCTVDEVELNRSYAVVVTTPGGLWSYILGDTIRFTRHDPLRLVITGRTDQYVNTLGENLLGEEVERALMGACRRTEADVVEFTVAPRPVTSAAAQPGHEWLVEFRTEPHESQEFARVLDETLAALNAKYRALRRLGMAPPSITRLPAGSFVRWMRTAGRLGDQHKVPRLLNSRVVADAVLGAAGEGVQPLAESGLACA